MIECRELGKQYGPKWAIRDLNLVIPAGTVYGFLGPNGAGKTTTVPMMVGLLRPTTGTVLIDGHDIVRDPVGAKRCLGYVPDEDLPALYAGARAFALPSGATASSRSKMTASAGSSRAFSMARAFDPGM